MSSRFGYGALVALIATQAGAADLPPVYTEPAEAQAVDAGRSLWALQITPYLWAAGLEGDVSPFRRAPVLSVDQSFSDVLDHLDFGGFLDIWARYDRFVFSGDVMYVRTSDSRVIGALPIIGPTPGLSAELDSKQFNATAKAGYRVFDGGELTLDLLAGVRYWRVSNDVTVSFGPFAVSYGETFDWFDPVIGLRGFYRISPKFSVQGSVDVGGFGAGSERTWQALATANYAFSDHLSVSAGYKITDVKYDKDGYLFDTTLQGPVVGMTYRF